MSHALLDDFVLKSLGSLMSNDRASLGSSGLSTDHSLEQLFDSRGSSDLCTPYGSSPGAEHASLMQQASLLHEAFKSHDDVPAVDRWGQLPSPLMHMNPQSLDDLADQTAHLLHRPDGMASKQRPHAASVQQQQQRASMLRQAASADLSDLGPPGARLMPGGGTGFAPPMVPTDSQLQISRRPQSAAPMPSRLSGDRAPPPPPPPQQQQQQPQQRFLRKADFVIINEDTAVKNAAGAIAKVLARVGSQGLCCPVYTERKTEQVTAVISVAVKAIAVARDYVANEGGGYQVAFQPYLRHPGFAGGGRCNMTGLLLTAREPYSFPPQDSSQVGWGGSRGQWEAEGPGCALGPEPGLLGGEKE